MGASLSISPLTEHGAVKLVKEMRENDFYSTYDGGSRHPSDHAVIGRLRGRLKYPRRASIYTIIDGLAECPNTFGIIPSPREKMLVCIEELVDLHLLNLHICGTSRSQADITHPQSFVLPSSVSA